MENFTDSYLRQALGWVDKSLENLRDKYQVPGPADFGNKVEPPPNHNPSAVKAVLAGILLS